jgi:hypothetical protein
MKSNLFDSTVWNDYRFRDDDVIVATYGKVGTVAACGKAETFINKGPSGRWRDMLPAEDSRNYEERALKELEPECAHWLATGELPRRRTSCPRITTI